MKTFIFLILLRFFPGLMRFDVFARQRADQERAVYWRDFGRHVEHAMSAAGIAHCDAIARRNAQAVADYYWRSFKRRNLPIEHAITGMRDGVSRVKPTSMSSLWA